MTQWNPAWTQAMCTSSSFKSSKSFLISNRLRAQSTLKWVPSITKTSTSLQPTNTETPWKPKACKLLTILKISNLTRRSRSLSQCRSVFRSRWNFSCSFWKRSKPAKIRSIWISTCSISNQTTSTMVEMTSQPECPASTFPSATWFTSKTSPLT